MENKTQSRLSLKFLFFVTSLIVLTLVYYDTTQKGSWQKSNTNRILTNLGVCKYTQKVIYKIKDGLLLMDEQIEQNFPSYRNATVEFSKPYIKLSQNVGYVFYNVFIDVHEAALEYYPGIIHSIESNAPEFLQQSQNVAYNVWSSSVFYFNNSVDYLRNEVFVGQLSPENMQKVIIQMLNTTQSKASEYYHWLYKEVQSRLS